MSLTIFGIPAPRAFRVILDDGPPHLESPAINLPPARKQGKRLPTNVAGEGRALQRPPRAATGLENAIGTLFCNTFPLPEPERNPKRASAAAAKAAGARRQTAA